MKTEKIANAIKNNFYANRQERRGIIILLVLIWIAFILPRFYQAYLMKPIEPKWVVQIPRSAELKPAKPNRVDLNQASSSTLLSIGFTAKEVQVIHHYRKSKGRIRSIYHLQKIIGFKSNRFKAMGNKLVFPSSEQDTLRRKKVFNQPLELNGADSVQLVALYRIGPAMAHRIIEYRNKLGGFVGLDQLKEIWGFDEDILYDLQDKIFVNSQLATTYDLNRVTLEELQKHAYFKFRLSNAIIQYRTQHGTFQSLNDLRKIVLINDSVFRRVTRYLYLP